MWTKKECLLSFFVILLSQASGSDSGSTELTNVTPATSTVSSPLNISATTASANSTGSTTTPASVAGTTNGSTTSSTSQSLSATTVPAKYSPLNATTGESSTTAGSSTPPPATTPGFANSSAGTGLTGVSSFAPTSTPSSSTTKISLSSSSTPSSTTTSLTSSSIPFLSTTTPFGSSTTPNSVTNSSSSLVMKTDTSANNTSGVSNQSDCSNTTTGVGLNDTSSYNSSAGVQHLLDEPPTNLTIPSLPNSFKSKNGSSNSQSRYHQAKPASLPINSDMEIPLPLKTVASSAEENNNDSHQKDVHSIHKKNSDIIDAATSKIAQTLKQQPLPTSNEATTTAATTAQPIVPAPATTTPGPSSPMENTVQLGGMPAMPVIAPLLPALNGTSNASKPVLSPTSPNATVIKLPPMQSSFEDIYVIGDTGNATIHRENHSLSIEATNNY